MLIGDTTIFLTTLLVLAVGLHYFVIYGLGTGTGWLTSSFRQAVLRNPLILSYRLQWTFVFPLTVAALIVVLVGFMWYRTIRRGFAVLLLALICVAGIANGFYRSYELYVARTKPAQVYNRAEYELVNAGDIVMARRLFEEIHPHSKEQVLIEAWLAGINYLEGNYTQAIIDACDWLAYDSSIMPDYDTIAPSLVTTVHWSLYQLAHTVPFAEALEWRNELLEEMDESQSESGCFVNQELSPFFFGISPDNRAFIKELPQKYAPPALYTYLGILSGYPERYPLPEGAIVDEADRETLTWLLATPLYGDGEDDQREWYYANKYAYWGAFLIGDYNHSTLTSVYIGARERMNVASAAALAQAVNNLGDEPAQGIARITAFVDPNNYYAQYLMYEHSPWLDDVYALLMYLWSQQGDIDRALDYYSELSQLDEYDILCDFCNPWSVLGLGVSTEELETLVANQDPRINMTACDPPYLLDLLGLKQLSQGRYDKARATFRQLGEQCNARHPDMDAHDYLRLVSLLEAIDESPTKENYQRFFKTMDQSWTWGYQGDVPLPETWFLQNAVYRTNNWPVGVFVRINPWITYAQLLKEYADRFAQDSADDVRIPASLLQAAWIYDVLAARPGDMLNKDAQAEYTRQLQARAAAALEHYLELYYERDDVPAEFCRYYRGNDEYPARYNVVQDCTIEWLALLHLGAHQDEDISERYDEQDIVAMQEQARKLVDRYPSHHLANNLLTWIAWGYCYRANLYSAYSGVYIEYYRSALQTYQELLDKYPSGAQATNARENIRIIEKKLRSPEDRRQVPEGRWTWDVAEKSVPQLEDFLK
jgi:outer membrane protein assembly factor BamD (BamD/ComL family)